MRRIGLHALAALLMLWTSLACSPSASTERVVTLASEPVTSAPTDEVTLGYGRVVDEQGAPVADATVELKHGDRLLGRAMSGADGKFEMRGVRIDTDWSSPPLLCARSSDGRAVHRSALNPELEREYAWRVEGPRDEDWRDIVLRPAQLLEVRVVGAPASVAVEVHLLQTGDPWNWWGWLPIASTQHGGTGTVLFGGLPPGRIQVTAIDGAHGACAYTTLPSTDVVELNFKPLRTCEVRLVNRETGLPVSGAELRLELVASASGASPGAQNGDLEVDGILDFSALHAKSTAVGRAGDQRSVWTDQAGLARLTGLLPGEYYRCDVDAEGYRRERYDEGMGHFRVLPSEGAKTIFLRPQRRTTMRWLIPTDHGPAPADGTVIAVRQSHVLRGETVFGPTLRGRMENGLLVVHDVLDQDWMRFVAVAPDGSTADLTYFAAEVTFDHELLKASSFTRPVSATGERLDVYGRPMADAASLTSPRSVTVELRDVRGQPASGVRVSLNGSRVPVDDVVTDALGLARFDKLWPDRVTVSASGSHSDFSRYSVTIGEANLADGDASFRATWRQPFRAIATVTLDGRVGLPSAFHCTPEPIWADKEGGRFDFELPSPDEGQTVPVHLMAYGFESAYTALTPNADGSTVYFELDLKSIDYHVVVRTEGFEGFKLRAERVAGAIEDHAFVNRIPDDARDERRRRAELATYTASADGAEVHIPLAEGRWRIVDWWSGATTDEFELRHHSPTAEMPLLPGPFAPLRVHITPPEPDYQPKSFRVGAYALGEAHDTLTWLTHTRTRNSARAYELGRGAWSLWIDPGDGWAPIRMERVEIGERGATVGPLELTRGSTLRVRVPADASGSRPHLYVRAALNGAPPFSRVLQSQGEAEVLLSGLCAGVYTVRIFDTLSTDIGPARRIEFDGTSEVTIDWKP